MADLESQAYILSSIISGLSPFRRDQMAAPAFFFEVAVAVRLWLPPLPPPPRARRRNGAGFLISDLQICKTHHVKISRSLNTYVVHISLYMYCSTFLPSPTMKLPLIALGLAGIAGAAAYSAGSLPSGRRAFLQTGAATAASVAATTAVGGVQPAFADEGDYADFVDTESGLRYKITKEGDGAVPEAGQTVKAHYTGWLDGFDSIKKFDSSRDRNRPFSFRVGAGQVIRGWDETFASMKVGERRQIIIPSRLG